MSCERQGFHEYKQVAIWWFLRRDGVKPIKKSFRDYIASKRRYFFPGLWVHLVVTGAGEQVEFSLAGGSEADVTIFRGLELDLPEGSIIFADKAYTDYHYEDLLEEVGLHLKAWARRTPRGQCRRGRRSWASRFAST